MPSFTKKQQIGILVVGISLILAVNYFRELSSQKDYHDDFEKIRTEEVVGEDKVVDINDENTEGLEKNTDITVYIKGAISKPGIVTIESGKRVIDVVDRAGGFLESADFENVNLARKVQDEEMIHIPHVGEEVEAQTEVSTSNSSGSSTKTTDQSPNSSVKININTDSQEELKELSGIGDATAEKIIQHREESPFSRIEDIMEVSGIGEKKFEAIKDNIVVN